ncbi:L-aspartate oxidase [Agaribacter marinus]|uniref:L-aspartate oxidase n=1 Tax=Virgibacillus salarius TaxID=447199 RepID=A0A941IC66_9BACI|nr:MULTISPECIES: L-aspartate oxidase [Bacillaceae]MBR7797161.1 L-aspartate oxidase [Virgibacillus salarius]NAZ09870.1 L-aspartate oxidase [Agaribacter marinus]
MNKIDVIIVGSGIAALQLAYKLSNHKHVMIITKGQVKDSNSFMAQGGIAAAIAKTDSPQQHFHDTMTAGEGHGNEYRVNDLVEEGKKVIEELIDAGAPFDLEADGSLSLGVEGAHRVPRILHSGGDQTGKKLVNFLLESLQASDHITWMENVMVMDLILNRDGKCIGIKAKNSNEELLEFYAPHVVLASGGAGGLFTQSSNHPTILGDGIALAYRAGASVGDLEFLQFHPTLLSANGKTVGLISEAVRGAGAILVNDRGERIMEGIHDQQDLGPRHVVAHEIFKQVTSGKYVFLDITTIHNFKKRFPSISQLCKAHHVDLSKGKIPVLPGSHFMMGGVVTDRWGCTSIKGLYAIGEVACSGVHGANRLASNSLLEGFVYGSRLSMFLLKTKVEEYPKDFVPAPDNKNPLETLPFTRKELQEKLTHYVGIIRNNDSLQHHFAWLNSFSIDPFANIDQCRRADIQTYFMWINSVLMTQSALIRTESRGGHIRSDFPNKDYKRWLRKSIIHYRKK